MRKIFLSLLSICFLFITHFASAQSNKVQSYIDQYKHLAIEEMVRTGVPAAISLAQGIVESGAGTSWLSVNANNQFGIKCKSSWVGEKVYQDDDRRNECFRKYPTSTASWKDHSDFLKNRKRYHFLFYLDPLDYKAWAYGLKEAGYATNNKYPQLLVNTIRKYHLNQYSKRGLALSKKAKNEEGLAATSNSPSMNPPTSVYDSPHKNPSTHRDIRGEEDRSFSRQPITINKRTAIYLPVGTQLISIASKYDIRLKRLLRWNELNTGVLTKDMPVFIEKKRRRGSHSKHIVHAGETYHEIAQKEGMRLKWLLKRNYLSGNGYPQTGDVLILQGYVREKGGNQKISGFSIFVKKLFGGDKQDTFIYTVKSGDTLYDLAGKYNTTVKNIQKINHIRGSLIVVGQSLKIPRK